MMRYLCHGSWRYENGPDDTIQQDRKTLVSLHLEIPATSFLMRNADQRRELRK